MKKSIKKSFLAVMAMLLLVTSVLSANVSASEPEETDMNIVPVVGVYNYSQVSPASSNTYYLGTKTNGNYTYEVNRYYGNWYAIFNMDLSMPYYKGTTAMTVEQTIARSYGSQSAYEFSTSTGGTASVEVIEITKSITNTVSYTTSVSFELSSSVSYDIERTDSSGYYKIGVCHDIYRHRVDEYYGATKIYEYDMPTPKGVAYCALLYSTQSGSGYHKY